MGVGDGGYELSAISQGCCFLFVSACACAAVRRGVEDGGVGGGFVIRGVPVGGGVLVPVHRGYVGYAGGNFDVWFYVLYGRVVCRAGVPNRVVEDDGCVCASGIIVLWFVVVWVGEGLGRA